MDNLECGACENVAQCYTLRCPISGTMERGIMVILDSPSGDVVNNSRSGVAKSDKNIEALQAIFRDNLGLLFNRDCGLTYVQGVVQTSVKTTVKSAGPCIQRVRSLIREIQPRVIIAMGSLASSALTGSTGSMAKVRGAVVDVSFSEYPGDSLLGGGVSDVLDIKIPVVSTFSPGYVMHNPAALEFIVSDIARAVDIADGKVTARGGLPAVNYRIVCDEKTMDEFTAEFLEVTPINGVVAWDTETSGLDPFAPGAKIVCVTFSFGAGSGWLVPLHHAEPNGELLNAREGLVKFVLTNENVKLIGQNLKFDMLWVWVTLGFKPNTPAFDCMVAAHLLDENKTMLGGSGLKQLVTVYAPELGGYEKPIESMYPDMYERMATIPLRCFDPGSWADLLHYAVGDVDAVMRVFKGQYVELEANNQLGTMRLEMMKLEILTRLEFQGAVVDWAYNRELSDKLQAEAAACLGRLESWPEVIKCAGKDGFKPNSPKQVRQLFSELGLKPSRVTKSGAPSVDREEIEAVIKDSQIPQYIKDIFSDLILYRRVLKLDGTYVSGLGQFRSPDGKVHARFNQTRTVTWRLSCESPNLQNLPRKETEFPFAGLVKKQYVSAFKNGFVMEADYSQVELRIAALLSQDANMISEYRRKDCDLHRRTAALIFGVAPEDVKPEQRSYAKSVNFGIVYGMGPKSLAEQINVSEDYAAEMLTAFFRSYNGLAAWIDYTKAQALRNGYVESAFGHRRHLPALLGSDEYLREEALRAAVNSPIQCTASNLTVYAEHAIDTLLRNDNFQTRCFGQVHDSIWLTGPDEELNAVAELVKLVMENMPFDFLTGNSDKYPERVPLVADVKYGTNLGDMYEWKGEQPNENLEGDLDHGEK